MCLWLCGVRLKQKGKKKKRTKQQPKPMHTTANNFQFISIEFTSVGVQTSITQRRGS